MRVLEMLKFQVLIIVYHVMLTTAAEDPPFGINGSFGSPEKHLVLILVKQTQNFAWIYIIMMIIVTCLLIETNSLNLKPTTKMLTFQQFCQFSTVSFV